MNQPSSHVTSDTISPRIRSITHTITQTSYVTMGHVNRDENFILTHTCYHRWFLLSFPDVMHKQPQSEEHL